MREYAEQSTHERLRALLGERFAPGDLKPLLAEGAALTRDQAIAQALG